MKDFTLFLKFREDKGNISIERYFELITKGAVSSQIEAIRRYDAEGNDDMANKLKKGLPAVTVAATFKGGRDKNAFVALSGMTVLDIDELNDPQQLAELIAAIRQDSHTLLANISSRGHGLKIIVSICPEQGALPEKWEDADRFYRMAYAQVVDYYRTTFGCEVDTSGKDITRLNFLSYDPEAYYNPDATAFLVSALCSGDTPSPSALPLTGGRMDPKKEKRKLDEMLGNIHKFLRGKGEIYDRRRSELLRIIFMNLIREGYEYRVGERHDFLYRAIQMLNEYGMNQNEVENMRNCAEQSLQCAMEDPNLKLKEPREVNAIIRDVYTRCKEEHGTRKLSKSVISQIYLRTEIDRVYIIHDNLLSLKIEILSKKDWTAGKRRFQEMNDKNLNDLSITMGEMYQSMRAEDVNKVIKSSFATPFDPIQDYIDRLPEWDGTDHIGLFVQSIETDAPDMFLRVMKMFLVGMIATYFDEDNTNHIMPILHSGSQGVGKTWLAEHLLPPELRPYCYSGTLKNDKDSLSYVATKILICVDEVDKLNREERTTLQRIMTCRDIEFRSPYDRFSHSHPHKASFIGTCNDTSFMSNPTGQRRDFPFTTLKIDMDYRPDYEQLYAQIVHLWRSGFKYYITSSEQEEYAAYRYHYENNTVEYDWVVKYLRKYPARFANKRGYTVTAILQWIQRYEKELVIDRGAINRMTKALGRENIEYQRRHQGSLYFCYLLTPNHVAYIKKYRTPGNLDVNFDKFVPREIIIAGEDGDMANICKARKFLEECEGNMAKAEKKYSEYITEYKDLSNISQGSLSL
jgi:hypothetical protein